MKDVKAKLWVLPKAKLKRNSLLLSVFSAWDFPCRISPRLLLSRLNKLKRCKLSNNYKLKLIL